MMKQLLDPRDEKVGVMIECAVSFLLGRSNYNVSVVTDVVSSVVTELPSRTVIYIEQKIVKYGRFDYGDSKSRKAWMKLLELLRAEKRKRNLN